MSRIGFIAVTAILALMVAASTLFVVDQRQIAVVYALGEIKEVISEPGLKMKLPPPFQNVVFLDRRIQTLDSPETAAIFTAEKKSLVVDWLVKWRIADSRQFMAALERAKVKHDISRFFSPAQGDPAFHVEIPQPH